MIQQHKLFMIVFIYTTICYSIFKLSIFMILVHNSLLIFLYILIISIFEALPNNQNKFSKEIRNYQKRISEIQNKYENESVEDLRTNYDTTTIIKNEKCN